MSLTHWYEENQLFLPPRIWWQLTCASLSCLSTIWNMINLVTCWRYLSVAYNLMTFCKCVSFYMKATYLPLHLLPLIFPVLMCSLTKNAYPEMWKFWKNYQNDIIPCPISMFQNMSDGTMSMLFNKWCFECDPHRSADLTQRSRLFICVETNSWCMLSLSIALAVCWVNSAQFFSGKSMSTKQHYSWISGRKSHHSHLPIAHMPWEDI